MPKELRRMCSILPLLLDFFHKLWPIIVHGRQESAEVLKWNGVAQGLAVLQEYCLRSGPFFFYSEPDPLLLCPMGGRNLCAGMTALQGLLQHDLYLSYILIVVIVADFVIFLSSCPCKNVHMHREWRIQKTTKDRHKPNILVVIISFNIILFN